MHNVTMPRFRPSRRIEWRRRVVSTAPVAPIGWPCAIAPPSTLTMSAGRPSSRATAMATAANASLISKRSTSSELPAGARERHLHGRHRTEAEHAGLDRGDAVGDKPRERLDAARFREHARRPASRPQPLFNPGALPAVIVPSGRNAGVSGQRFDGRVRARLCSSA